MSETGNNKADGSEIYEDFGVIVHPDVDLMPIYRRRAEIRNAQRSLLERSTVLTDFLDLPSFPMVTGEDIEAEYELEIQRRKDSMVESGDDDLVDDVRAVVRQEVVECVLSVDMERDEKVKYIVRKMAFCLKKGKLKKARRLYGCTSVKNKKDEKFLDLFSNEAGGLVVDYFLYLVERERFDEAVNAFYGLGAVISINEADLEGVEFSEPEKKMFLKHFERELKAAFDIHPTAYLALRDSLKDLGMYKDLDFDSLINVEKKIRKMLTEALDNHPIIYVGLLSDFEKAGLVDAKEVNTSEYMRGEMKKCLAGCLAIAPRIYCEMRDRFEKYDLLEADEADCSCYVRAELKQLLKSVIEKYPELYEWMKLKMKNKGLYLSEEQEEEMDIEYERKLEIMDRWNIGWVVGDKKKKKWNAIGKLDSEFEEKFNKWANTYGLDDEQHRIDCVRKFQREIMDFLKKYPQYRDSIPEFDLLELPAKT